MFNPKLDMSDSEEKAKPSPDWTFKKKSDNSFLYAGLALAIAIIVTAVLWSQGAFAAKVCVTVSESRSSVQAQHTILFKRKC